MTDTKPPEAQPKKALIYKYLHIPEGEYFNPDRPSLEAACGGNRTQGSVLGYLASKACYIAEKSKLEGRVVRITVERADILRALRISEKTYICCLKALNGYKYTDAKRYARSEIDIDLDAIDKGIANPPAQKLRGRPRGTRKCAKVEGIKGTENTSTLSEIPSTYVQELEMKVEALSEKLKVLQDKVESITTFEKELQLFRKVLQLSLSSERTSQEALAAFSQRLEVLESNERDNERGNSVSAFASTPAPASLDSASHSLPSQWLSEEGEIAIDENDTHSQLSTPDVENLFDAVDNLDPDATIGRMPAIPKGQTSGHDNLPGIGSGCDGGRRDRATAHGDGVRAAGKVAHAGQETPHGQEEVTDAQPTDHAGATPAAHPAVRGPLSSAHPHNLDNHEIDTLQAQHGKDAEHTAAPSPTGADTPAASLVPPVAGKSAKGKGRGKPEKVPETLEDMLFAQRRRAWQAKINERRGAPLRTAGECINETKCLGLLVREYTDEQIQAEWDYLFTLHWKYSKLENKFKIGGKVLLDEAGPSLMAIAELAHHGGKPDTRSYSDGGGRRHISSFDDPNYRIEDEFYPAAPVIHNGKVAQA